MISHSFGFRPGVDPDRLGQLADALEAEAFANKLHRAQISLPGEGRQRDEELGD
jgi:hypothetical protein